MATVDEREGVVDDGTARRRSWKGWTERGKAGQKFPPPSDSQQSLTWIHLLNGRLMISRPRLCVVLGMLSAQPENHSFVMEGVLLICLRVCLVMGKGLRQTEMGVYIAKRL